MAIEKSTIQLLRLPFSFFLMPVYWFALGQVVDKDWGKAALIFFILHGLVYPASNGYNSYMDRDTTPIGGLRAPMQPTRQLFITTVGMDIIALAAGILVSPWFTAGLAVYILASRAYSYRRIRLKKYPIIGYLTVAACQGALIFFLVYRGSHTKWTLDFPVPLPGMIASSLLVGGFYPLTQLYQHEADRKDGVRTLSMLLGYKGSFVFTGLVYGIAFATLAYYYYSTLQIKEFYVLATCMLPVTVYFFIWAAKVWRDPGQASFVNTMRMNLLASICINAGFIAVLAMG
ncbi:MAG: UbiA family prenyltransferase [Bacteroidota bacterium]|nr:UbiA family prenyltransferase [Bacteroidota bacterium]